MLAIAAIFVFIWFYKTAVKNGIKNVWGWAAFGVVAYYISGIIWVYWILKPAMGKSFHNLSPFQGTLVEISGIAIALLAVYAIKRKFLSSQND